MAGDWIKMRVGLRRHPKVVRMASALHADKLRIVGALHAVWGLFDEHSADGRLAGYTLEVLDEDLAFPGFGQALVNVEWLVAAADALLMPRFDAHNGQSAKRRAQDADRKRMDRQMSASQADTCPPAGVTREEESREEASSSLRSEEEARQARTAETRTDPTARNPKQELPSVDKSTGGKPPEGAPPAELIFSYGVPLLTAAGVKEQHARSFLGGLRKEYGDEAVIEKLRACAQEKPLQPLQWLAAALPPRKAGAKHSGFASKDYRKGVTHDGTII